MQIEGNVSPEKDKGSGHTLHIVKAPCNGCERHVHACFKTLAISALVCTTTFHAATILHAHMQLRQWPSPSIHKPSRQLASQSLSGS